MNTDEIAERILQNTYTKVDCYRRLALLEDYLDRTLFAAGTAPKPDFLSMYAQTEDGSHANAVAQWNILNAFSSQHFAEEILNLKKKMESLPGIILYVPVVLETAGIEMIGQWCRKEIQPNLLLEIQIDPAVAGGCAFVWKNVFYNFSLEYFMNKHRNEILKVFGMPSEAPVPTS
jgi:hypothetical protein